MGIGAGLTKAGDGTVDQLGIDLRQTGIVQPVFRQPADLEILDQHIGVGDKGAHLRLPLGGLEITNHRRFAPVRRVEIGRRPLTIMVDERRTPAAGVVTIGCLDLDHLRPQIGKGLTGPRASQNPRQFDDRIDFRQLPRAERKCFGRGRQRLQGFHRNFE